MPFSQTDSFETDFGNWTNDTVGDQFNWTRNNTTTPSAGTGPGGGYDGSWYIYTETSSPVALDDEAVITSNTINGSIYDITVAFRAHMVGMGDGTGYLALEAWNGTAWTEVWRQTGDNGATENGTDYVLYSVNLDSQAGAPYDNTDLQVRFRLHVSSGGSAFENDAALDAITISGPDRFSADVTRSRARNDDGSESAATWKAAENTDIEIAKDTGFRLRGQIDASGSATIRSQAEYKEEDDPDTEYRKIPTS